jgi:hypothetical protein
MHIAAPQGLERCLNKVSLPGDRKTGPILRVYANGRAHEGNLSWTKVTACEPPDDSLLVTGLLAWRMVRLLRIYDGKGPNFAPYVSDPDCHGAAMFAMGIVDHLERLSPWVDFPRVYEKRPARFTYEPLEAPALVHLLSKELSTSGIPDFRELNTPHSVVYLGNLNGAAVCFEKRGKNPAGFATLQSTEEHYGSRLRMYVEPRNGRAS